MDTTKGESFYRLSPFLQLYFSVPSARCPRAAQATEADAAALTPRTTTGQRRSGRCPVCRTARLTHSPAMTVKKSARLLRLRKL